MIMKPSVIADVLPKLIEARMSFLLKSPPGWGKSSFVADAAARAKFELVIAHPVVDEPVDYKVCRSKWMARPNFCPLAICVSC
jgi:hypothetical protein